jgi:predicted nucleic acid-binding protein
LRGIVLADTGPLYAARDPNDDNHERSQHELRRLKSQNLKVVVPYPTLLESYSLVMRELGIRTAHEFLEEVVPRRSCAGAFSRTPAPRTTRRHR